MEAVRSRYRQHRTLYQNFGLAAFCLVALIPLLIVSSGALPRLFSPFGFAANQDVIEILLDAADSVARLLAGLSIGTFVGVAIGAVMGGFAWVDRLLSSLIHPLRQVPLFGWLPLIGLWAGLGEASKITFVSLAVAYVMIVAAHDGIRSVPPHLAEVGRALRLGRWQLLRALIFPAALPSLFAGFRIALAAAWSAVVGAEILMAAAPGLGALIWGGREVGRTDLVLGGTVIIALLGIASSLALRKLETWALPWLQH